MTFLLFFNHSNVCDILPSFSETREHSCGPVEASLEDYTHSHPQSKVLLEGVPTIAERGSVISLPKVILLGVFPVLE